MNMLDRRGVLAWGAVAALVLPRAVRAQDATQPLFPAHPFAFTRELRRELRGGGEVRVTRRYAIDFEPVGAGWRVEGTHMRVTATAPPALGALVAAEEGRIDPGPFPLMLTEDGLIVRHPVNPAASHSGHFTLVREAMDDLALQPEALAEAERFISGLDRTGGIAPLPIDLFRPAQPAWTRRYPVALDDGSDGNVDVAFAAHRDAATGLLLHATRSITTQIGEQARSTIESWSLAPL